MKVYPEYKSSGIDWLGEIPRHWGNMRVKYFLDQITDSSTSERKIALENIESQTGRYVETNSDFEGNGIDFKKGDIVYGKLRPYLKKVWVAEFDGNAIGDFFVYRTRPIANNRFIKWLFLTENFTSIVNQSTYGAKMPRVSSDFVKDLFFPLPDIKEQDSIADYLDDVTGKVDALIAEKQKQVDDLRAYRISLITETVTRGLNPNAPLRHSGIDWIGDIPRHWEISALKYLTSKIGSGVTPKGGSEVYLNEGVLFIRSQNVYPDGLHLDDPTYISESIDESMSNTRVYTGDILLNITGASIGRCCVYTMIESANVNQHVCIIRSLGNLIINQYLCYMLNSKIGQDQIALYQTGGNREGLNFEQLRNFAIPLPPLSEQHAIAEFLDEKTVKIDALIDELSKQLDELAEYKKAVISEAVTGKVDVRDWTPNN